MSENNIETPTDEGGAQQIEEVQQESGSTVDPMDLSAEDFAKSVEELIDAPEPTEVESIEAEPVQKSTEPDETFEIVYKGETKKLSREEIKNLAQKGFSYHQDMNRIASKKKLVSLIEEDEEIGKLVDDYVRNRAKPKVTKLEDYSSEEEWLSDNIKRINKAEKYAKQTQSNPGQEIIEFFRMKDPENYEKVLVEVAKQANDLTVNEYIKVNSSMEELERFYDTVKGRLANPEASKPKQTFRMKSGGGEVSRPKENSTKVWELSAKDFNKAISEARGY